ncbi:hypothetical protein AAVH_01923 [Aphelenchoides avenae]|nr:hypothetical protein AAVH_01923 [Aphelenchus avenae]
MSGPYRVVKNALNLYLSGAHQESQDILNTVKAQSVEKAMQRTTYAVMEDTRIKAMQKKGETHESVLDEDQVLALIQRTWRDGGQANWPKSKQFYAWLVKTELCRNEDLFLHLFVEEYMKRTDNDVVKCLDEYVELAALSPYTRIHHGCVYRLLLSAHKQGLKDIYNKVLDMVEKNGSAFQRKCMDGAVLLATDRAMQFFDRCKMDKKPVADDEVNYLCIVAEASKEPRILHPLVELGGLLPEKPHLHAKIYNALALMHGKKGEIEELEQLWKRILKNYRRNELQAFKYPLVRIRHFYRTLNVSAPDRLVRNIRMLDR